jgi:hypothetical protein
MITVFLNFINNLKVYHWHTEKYSRHKASDDLFTNMSSLVDKFVEVYIGKYGRSKVLKSARGNIKIDILSDKNIVSFIKEFNNFLILELPRHVSKDDTDLITLRDDMLITLNQTLYLFTLN